MRIFFLFVFLTSHTFSQSYLFNNKKDSVLYTGYVNTLFVEEGTPLNFDGTIHVEPTKEIGSYHVVVHDTVTRLCGKLNITSYLEASNGEKEKVFIDKFSFNIKKGPEAVLFIGDAVSGEKIDTLNLEMKIGFSEPFPEPNFTITEVSLILEKEVLTIKSNRLTQQVINKIKSLPPGYEIEILVFYKDPLDRPRRVKAMFIL